MRPLSLRRRHCRSFNGERPTSSAGLAMRRRGNWAPRSLRHGPPMTVVTRSSGSCARARKAAYDCHEAFAGSDEKPHIGPTTPEMLAIIAKYTGATAGTIKVATPFCDPEARLDVKDVLHQIAWYKSQAWLDPRSMAKQSSTNAMSPRYPSLDPPRLLHSEYHDLARTRSGRRLAIRTATAFNVSLLAKRHFAVRQDGFAVFDQLFGTRSPRV